MSQFESGRCGSCLRCTCSPESMKWGMQTHKCGKDLAQTQPSSAACCLRSSNTLFRECAHPLRSVFRALPRRCWREVSGYRNQLVYSSKTAKTVPYWTKCSFPAPCPAISCLKQRCSRCPKRPLLRCRYSGSLPRGTFWKDRLFPRRGFL